MAHHGELHYGFFGLTALGPSSTFKQGQKLSVGVTLFSDEEWMQSFAQFDSDKSGNLDLGELENMLTHLYHGPPPKFVLHSFMQRFDSNNDGFVSKEEFMNALTELKANEKNIISMGRDHEESAAMYNSASEYQGRVKSHKLLDVLPKEKFHSPMTTNMAVGWADVDYKKVLSDIIPKKSCPETLYADAMVKAGVYYV